MTAQENQAKILILATEDCAYPGADATGQAHMSYPENTYILRVRAPAMFPEGAYNVLAARIEKVYRIMRDQGLDPRRLRLTGICTVCTRAFIKEVNQMNDLMAELGPPGSEKKAA
ncbi:MAG: hydrogenase iron-sulfur subunit [Deltaproteobacteria bacterium]|nr:hydrogenase iron-sulfur subunit [Deltaproteobacteria bacterium]